MAWNLVNAAAAYLRQMLEIYKQFEVEKVLLIEHVSHKRAVDRFVLCAQL